MLTLVGILIVVVGFALRLNPLLVVTIAALATGLASGLGPIEVVSAFGKAFTESRYIAIVWLLLPVIGSVDSHRGSEIMSRLLAEIVAKRATDVIVDMTGVEIVDTSVADHFIKLVGAMKLLGTRGIITGIQPAVAQAMVGLGVDLVTIVTLRNLEQGLRLCMRSRRAADPRTRR